MLKTCVKETAGSNSNGGEFPETFRRIFVTVLIYIFHQAAEKSKES
jgi:hypothetical protein